MADLTGPIAMETGRAFSQPLIVDVVDGEVVIRGPEGPTGVSLTPAAAAETAQRIAAAARRAAEVQASQGSAREA